MEFLLACFGFEFVELELRSVDGLVLFLIMEVQRIY